MKKLVFATNNPNKLKEVQQILGDAFQLLSLKDINCADEIPEDHDTLEANASQKAWHICKKYGMDCFADDTGLEVPALDNRPGVYSARYAGDKKDFETSKAHAQANMQKLLQELTNKDKRQAQFRTVISLIVAGKELQFEGIVEGNILEEKRGTGGFGYDPVFQPKGYEESFAEMDATAKNLISHRGRAFKKLIEYLINV